MRKFVFTLLVSALCFSCFSFCADAQDRKIVTGRIVNKATGKPFGKNDVIIEIFAFDTEGLAEDALEVMKTGIGTVTGAYEILPPDEAGYYQATLPQTGALIFRPGISDPIMEPIRNRSVINVAIDAGEIITASKKVAETGNIIGLEEEVEIDGHYLNAYYCFRVPANVGRKNARLILQPFFYGATENEFLGYLRPWVFDGSEYGLTQNRRMGYNMNNDPLNPYVLKDTLTSGEFIVPWRDTVYLENPKGKYYVKGKLIIEDYNAVFYSRDSLPLASSRARRPMQFLDYHLSYRNLDHEKYRQRARPEKMDTKGEMSLTFLVNEAKLDDSNPDNAILMNSLKELLYEIATGENSRLIEFHITGVASPDGVYDRNMALAKRRTKYAYEEVLSVLPHKVLRRVYSTQKSIVLPWTDVADLLEKEGYPSEAAEVRAITERVKSRDGQFRAIKALPSYASVISPLLPKLRTVKYTFKHEEMRELTPEEILNRYRTDEAYRSGQRHFALYEYWNLFGIIKDKEELFELYKRAYNETLEDNGTPWILAANNLAVSYLERGICDTTILKPFIDERWKANKRMRNMNGTEEVVNPEEIISNQLCMFLMENKFKRASVMALMLPNTESNKVLKAIAMCLGGYYKGGKTDEERRRRMEWFEIAKESTPRNKVVMLLSPNTRAHTLMAERAVEDLPQDDALTWYFKAVISGRKCDYPDSDFLEPYNFESYLTQCFDLDSSFVDIARGDGDIDEDMLKEFLKFNPKYGAF